MLRVPSGGNPAITYRPNRHVNTRVRNPDARQRTNRSQVPDRELPQCTQSSCRSNTNAFYSAILLNCALLLCLSVHHECLSSSMLLSVCILLRVTKDQGTLNGLGVARARINTAIYNALRYPDCQAVVRHRELAELR